MTRFKKITIRKATLLISVLFLNASINSQNKVKIGLPIEFKSFWSKKSVEAVLNKGNKITLRKYWQVFSNAENNKTYESSESFLQNIKKNNIGFLSSFIVSEIDGTSRMVHLYKRSKSDKTLFPNIGENFIDYGWIEIDNIIPSVYPENKIKEGANSFKIFTEKALVMHIVNNESKNKNRREIQELSFFKGPGTNEKANTEVEGEVPYYVFNTKNGMSLLSKRSKLDLNEDLVKQQIAGWISNEDIQVFSSRICWEPNYGDAAEYYKDFTFGVYDKSAQAIKVVDYGKDSPLANRQPFKLETERKNKSFNRMYQLKAPNSDNVAEVLILGNPNKKRDSLKNDVLKKRRQLRNMNVLFVIDGTQSMQPYIVSVSKAINNSIDILGEELKNGLVNSMKFGIGIYRDKTERKDGKMYEYMEFTSDKKKVNDFLGSTKAYSNPGDDEPEAVYQGLKRAMTNFKKDQKNVLIWIGDAGNIKSTYSEILKKDIIKLSKDYEVNWAVFQVFKKDRTTYDDFMTDANEIVIAGAENQLIKMNKTTKPGWKNNFNWTEMELDLYPNNKESEAYIMFASLNNPAESYQRMKADEISKKITSVIIKMHDNTKEELEKTQNYQINITDGKVDVQSEPMYDWLIRKGYNEDEIKILTEKSFRFKGWLPIRVESVWDDATINAQRDVVMLSSNELAQRKKLMRRLAEAADENNTDRKQALVEAFIDGVNDVLGERDDDSEIDNKIRNMTFKDLWATLFGIPFKMKKPYGISNTKISALYVAGDPGEIWQQEQVDILINRILESKSALDEVNEDYEYTRENGFKTRGGDNKFYYLERDIYFP